LFDRSKKLPAFFYENPNGHQPVKAWILELSPAEKTKLRLELT